MNCPETRNVTVWEFTKLLEIMSEKEMKNSPIYKVLQALKERESLMPKHEKVLENENTFCLICDLQDLVQREAPEIYELWSEENKNPEEDSLREEFAELKKGGQINVLMSFEEWNAPHKNPEFEPGEYICPHCARRTKNITGICKVCEENGVWIDPAGGIHTDDEEDPAAMYE